MKISLSFISCLLFAGLLQAQVPNKMSYQMVVRNSANALVSNQEVGVRIQLLKGSATGAASYIETHTPATNANGLASFIIGDGTVVNGSLATIDWSAGPYFIKTEVDPNGGTNYSITSTTQLLSVPYAMHAGSAPSQGKTYIILNGEITDEEAAAIIASDAGPQTQFVYIESTTELKHLDLTGLKSLLEIKITGNADLITVAAASLDVVYTKLQVGGNPQLSSLALPVLNKLGGSPSSQHYISGNHKLTSLSFPKLAGSPLASLSIINNDALLSVDFPVLEKFLNLSFSGSTLNSVTVPRLSTVKMLEFNFTGLVSMSAPSLISGNIGSLHNYTLASVSAPLLKSGDVTFLHNHNLSSISFPVLSKTALKIEEDSSLVNIELPAMTSGSIYLKQNINLQSISFPQLVKAQSIEVVANNKVISALFPMVDSSGNIKFSNTSMHFLSFPKLVTSDVIDISNSPNLGTLSFPLLKRSSNILIYMLANSDFHSLETADDIFISSGSADLSSLRTARTVTINNTGDFTLPALTNASSFSVNSPYATKIFMPELKVVKFHIIISVPNLTEFSTPKLDTVSVFSLGGTKVTSLDFPQLRVVKREMNIANNPLLTKISFPMLNGLGAEQSGGSNSLNLRGNRLPSDEINSILARLVSITPPLTGKYIDLSRQQPPAPPTGQGLVDRDTLRARFNSVTTD